MRFIRWRRRNQLGAYERRHSTARAKLLRALLEEEELDWDLVTHKLGVSGSVIRAMEESGVVKVMPGNAVPQSGCPT